MEYATQARFQSHIRQEWMEAFRALFEKYRVLFLET